MDELTDKRVGRVPDFKGEGIAIWKNIDKNGKLYLTAVILGNIRLNAFRYEPIGKENL